MENPSEETPPTVVETAVEEEKPVVQAAEAVKEVPEDEKADIMEGVVEQKEEAKIAEPAVENVPEEVKEEAPTEIKTETVPVEEKVEPQEPEIVSTEPEIEKVEENKENGAKVPEEDDKPPAEPPSSMHYIKIARIPRAVFDFMVRDEPEEGTVRLNLNQMKGFITDLWNSNAHVNSAIWDTIPYPAHDMSLPANTPKNCSIPNFATSNLAENEKMVVEKMKKIRDQEIGRYNKMNDEQKKRTWREVNREYVMTDNTVHRANETTKKGKVNEDVPSQIKPAEPLPTAKSGVDSAAAGKASKPTSQAKLGHVDMSPAQKNDNTRKRNQTPATPGAAATKKPRQDSPQKATPVAKKPQPRQQQPQKRQSLPNPLRQQPAGNKSFPKRNGNQQYQQQRNNKPDSRPKRFSDDFGSRNRKIQEAGANPWGSAAPPNLFGFAAAQDPMPGYHAYPYQNSGAVGVASMNPYAAPARDPYYDSHLADRERSMLERERRLLDQNYAGHQQQYSQPYADQPREFRTTFDNYAAAREAPVYQQRLEPSGYSSYAQDMNTSSFKSQQQTREYGRRY